MYSQVELYGRLFERDDQAAAEVAELRKRVDAVRSAGQAPAARTAAALFPFVNKPPGAYGANSMSATELETLGLTNVFGDVDSRYFEPTLEEIVARDPDVIVLLHTEGGPEEVRSRFLSIPGISNLTAVRNDAILVLRFEYTDPPTPLSVTGLERVAEAFGGGPR